MIRTILWFIYFWLYLIVCLPAYLYTKYLAKKGETEKVDRIVTKRVKAWANSLLRAAGATINVHGEENLPVEPAIFVANHQGNFDVPIMLGKVGEPRGLYAKIELKKLPFISWWMQNLHCVFIDRHDVKQSVKTLSTGVELLKQGYSLTIFPEGTRSRGGDMHEFKGGAFRIATKAGAPIVPVTISGSYKLMEANKKMLITPATVNVTIHPPIDTKSLTPDEIKHLPHTIKDIITSAL